MAKLISCDCGWTLITPRGELDLKKHAMIHVQDAHPGMKISDQDMNKMVKTI